MWGPVFYGDPILKVPQELKSNKSMKDIQIGENITALLDEDLHIYTWGKTNSLG